MPTAPSSLWTRTHRIRLLPAALVFVLASVTLTGSANPSAQSPLNSPTTTTTAPTSPTPTGEFVLRASADRIDEIAARNGLVVLRALDIPPYDLFLVRATDSALIATINTVTTQSLTQTIAADPEITDVEPNAVVVAPEVPSGLRLDQSPVAILDALSNTRSIVEFYGSQAWNKYVTQAATGAIRLSTSQSRVTGTGITVAVIDTGVDPRHHILAGSLVPGYDFVNDTAGQASEWTGVDSSLTPILDQSPVAILDQAAPVAVNQSTLAILSAERSAMLSTASVPAAFGHGTMVAGLIHLVAPGARIMPLKAFRADGTSTVFDIVRAIYFAVDNGARVINMSFSMDTWSPEMTHAINYATSRGVICVSSAGNLGREMLVYPAANRNVIAVGSTNASTPAARSGFSNYGDGLVALAAPGEAVITTFPGGGYAGAWGTSFSTPMVAGAAALFLQVDPTLDHVGVSNILGRSASTTLIGLGRGRLDLSSALDRVSDNIPPVVTITSPSSGTVSSTVVFAASVSDNVRVSKVTFRANGSRIGSEDTTAPFEVSWSTTGLPNGVYTLTVEARDSENNLGTATTTVTVANDKTAPVVSITSPGPGAAVAGAINVTATASDDIGVTGVQFLLDGAPLGAEDTTAPYSAAWNTSSTANGAHVITALARDAAGRMTTAPTINVAVENDAAEPSVSVTSPAANAGLAGSVTLTASASDDVRVVGVQFFLDGVPLGAEDVAAPFTATWNTAGAPNGAHTIGAVARDAAGRTGTAAPVSVTVTNDVAAPVVAIDGPAAGADVSGSIVLTASASDDIGVTGVQFFVNGSAIGPQDSTAPYEAAWDTASAANGMHTITAVARDAAGRTTTAAAVGVTVTNDKAAPSVTITGPAASETLSGSVGITAAAADDVAVAGVQFFLDGQPIGPEDIAAPYEALWDSATATNGVHALTAVARDAAGRTTTAAAVSVTVTNDLTAPSVVITGPGPSASLSGSVAVTASANDDVSVAGVQFFLNGDPLGAEHIAEPYEAAWDTTTAPNGVHVLTAVARDGAGRRTTAAAVSVTVTNDASAPTVTITAPGSSANLSGAIALAAAASDDVGVAGVQFLLNGAPLGAEDVAAPYQAAWDTTMAPNGVHVITAIARDAAGRTSTAPPVSVTVTNDTDAPAVTITSPAASGTLSGTVGVSAAASDDVEVAGVQFFLNGDPLGVEDVAAPYEAAWNTATAPNGAHVLTAIARDTAGRRTTAAAVSVTVANDMSAPVIGITGLEAGAAVAGVVTITADASDDVGVVAVQFMVDGTAVGAEDTVGPFEFTWDSTAAANGDHVITAVARDASGKTTTAAGVGVKVANEGGAPQPPL